MADIPVLHDFPNLTITQDPAAPVYRIAFKNLEFVRGGAQGITRGLLGFVIIVCFVPALFLVGTVTQAVIPGWGWVIGCGLLVVGFVAFFAWATRPALNQGMIEVDKVADRIRVFRNGRLTVERPLTNLQNLTVEDHPEAEAARAERQLKGEKRMSEAERTHCLFGWFGTGGAQKVLLVARAEWPNQQSLFEVRQAIQWVRETMPGMAPGDRKAGTGGGGMNPPLD